VRRKRICRLDWLVCKLSPLSVSDLSAWVRPDQKQRDFEHSDAELAKPGVSGHAGQTMASEHNGVST
jgi:hypothetical protein